MLTKIEMEGLKLPTLYIAENSFDAKLAMERGIPYIRWNKGSRALIRELLRPTLEKMFPYVKWTKVLGPRKFKTLVVFENGGECNKSPKLANAKANEENKRKIKELSPIIDKSICQETASIATEPREFLDSASSSESTALIEDYIGDLSSCVNLDVLQELDMLPKFLGDVVDCIKINLSNRIRWTEGYNKKLGVPIGNFTSRGELPNLIILDISGSIPRGIGITMVQLIDTMRSQLNAELIVTGSKSVYYSTSDELPDPLKMYNFIGRCNECEQFYRILNDHIAGREFGHIISFGDNDCPTDFRNWGNNIELNIANTKVHEVHHYHTIAKVKTGYARWVYSIGSDFEEHFDNSWCSIMEK